MPPISLKSSSMGSNWPLRHPWITWMESAKGLRISYSKSTMVRVIYGQVKRNVLSKVVWMLNKVKTLFNYLRKCNKMNASSALSILREKTKCKKVGERQLMKTFPICNFFVDNIFSLKLQLQKSVWHMKITLRLLSMEYESF